MGEWGSGKTTALYLLAQRLLASRWRFALAFANPWTARTPEEGAALLARAFDKALDLPTLLPRTWAEHPLWHSLLAHLPSVDIARDVLRLFRAGSPLDGDYSQRVDHILKARGTPIVVIIDDMDRADPEVVRGLLPILDRLFQIQNAFYVVALDPARLNFILGGADTQHSLADAYVRKIFDLCIALPLNDESDITQLCQRQVPKSGFPKLTASLPLLTAYLPRNPRAALRFVHEAMTRETMFLSRYKDDEYDFDLFFLTCMIEPKKSSSGTLRVPELLLFCLSASYGLSSSKV